MISTNQNDKAGIPNIIIAIERNKVSYIASAVRNLEKKSLELPLNLGFTRTIIDIIVPMTPNTETKVKIIPSTMNAKLSTGISPKLLSIVRCVLFPSMLKSSS